MRRLSLVLLALVLPLGVAQAQDSYVSAPLVKVMESGKFYMKLSGSQTVEDAEWASSPIAMSVELASRGGVSMSRTHTQMMDVVSLTTSTGTYRLDEAAKTWTAQPGAGAFAGGKLRFVRQGSCRVNGEAGWYFDEYRADDGSSFTFYYNSDKVSVLELGAPDGEGLGALNLQSFSSYIPSNMYFCVGNDWKEDAGAGGMDALGMAGLDKSALEAQIRESLKGEELPPGMSVDDLVKMAMGSMGGAAGKGGAQKKSAFPAPPKCATRWTDSGSPEELACGGSLSRIVISDKRNLSAPVYASTMQPAKPPVGPKDGLEVTEEGVRRAAELLQKEIQGMTAKEMISLIMDRNDAICQQMMLGDINGQLIEQAIARAAAYPHPATYSTVGAMYQVKAEPAKALEYYQAAEQMDPKDIVVEYGILDCYMDMENYAAARKVVPKIIELCEDGKWRDGAVYLRKAQLDIEAGELYEAVDDLFMSISLGHFEEESAIMLMSMLFQLEATGIKSADGLDFKGVLDRVFSENNLKLLRKGITWSFDNLDLGRPERTFPIDFAASAIKSIWPSLEMTADAMDTHRDILLKTAEVPKDKEDFFALYMAMGAAETVASGAQSMAETGINLDVVQKEAKGSARAQREIAKVERQFQNLPSMQGTYKMLSKALATKYGYQGFYLPDARAFYCLTALNFYHRWLVAYYAGGFSWTEDKDEDGIDETLHGCYPESFKARFKEDVRIYQKYERDMAAAAERHRAEEEKYSKQLEALAKRHSKHDAEEDECTREMARVLHQLMMATMVHHPQENLDITEAEDIALTRNNNDHFINDIKPFLEYWYADMGGYAQYIRDDALYTYFQFNAYADVYDAWAEPYRSAASLGKQLSDDQDFIDQKHAELEAEWERQEQERVRATILAKIEEDRRRAEAPGQERTLSDFYVTFPFGNFDLSVGYVDGHMGWKYKDNNDGSVLIGRFIGNETRSYRLFRTLADEPTPPNQELKGWVDGLIQNTMEALLGDSRSEAFKWMVGAANGARGKLLQTDGTRYEGTTRDSAGNIIPERVTEKTGSVDSIMWGTVSVTKRRTQIGAHVKKQTLSTFPMPFPGNYLNISFTIGKSSE